MAYNTSKGPRDLGDLKNESDTDTQIDWESDYIGLKTDGTTRLVISGTAGNVGIGTVSPSHTLQIDSNSGVEGLQVNGDANQYVASFRASTTSGQSYGPYVRGGTNSSDAALIVDNAAGTTSLLKLTGEGKLGIGIASPSHTLTVAGAVSGSGQTTLGNNLLISGDQHTGGTLNVSGAVTVGSILAPQSNSSQDLGSAAKKWANVYYAHASGSGTLQIAGATTLGAALNVSGAVTLAGVASGSSAGPGSFLAVNPSGLLVLDESSGGGISFNGSTTNGLVTYGGASTADVESNLTFNGSTLSIVGAMAATTTISGSGGVSAGGGVTSTGNLSGSGQLHINGTTNLNNNVNILGPLRAKQAHITHHGYNHSNDNERFIPFYNITDAQPTSEDYLQQMTAPFGGRLLRVIFRPETGQGAGSDTQIRLYKNSDGAVDLKPASSPTLVTHEELECSANAGTANVFNFSGSAHFAQGDIVGISITPQTGPNDVNVTCVWELDIFGV